MASEQVSYKATLAYADGLELFDNGDKPGALVKFKEALNISPSFDRARTMVDRLRTS